MPVSKTITGQLKNASWIRRMFEEGNRLKAERGPDHVFDFTLGNPEVEPPEQVLQALSRAVLNRTPHRHGYMPNAGHIEARAAVARQLSAETGLPFAPDHILMTVGASGACNVILKSILDPGDEVIGLIPCFSEYPFYVTNHAGRFVPVETDAGFLPDIERVAAAITPRTKAIIINSPNNPSGRIYPAGVLEELEELLSQLDHPITVISDEPYKKLVFDERKQTPVASRISQAAICNSWSKSQAIPGQRIGYLALSPRLAGLEEVRNACTFANRILGFINAPAIWQWVEAEAAEVVVDVLAYQKKRDLLCNALAAIGYDVQKPEGTFYVFPKTPVSDDVEFVRLLLNEGVLGVPGSGFGRSGYFRLSLTVSAEIITNSLPAFERAFHKCKEARPSADSFQPSR
ncbi:MAG: pyridoxal phosphate-dependent aminotransferase [Bryobacteraceae bacterium]|nr:pyridoxal phosphate-dependent aminotransferase [Bryobacterales bacterium]MEB2362386.1 pyridoxal phosphate-dependent aminotransferase [Bryobacterales bacterium]NUN00305.1 pyridoxal phosphate-dependent aminotransferase [Bryobacteraceae bacterium]